VIVAGDNEHSAMWGTAVRIAVFECVAGAIDTGAFAIPDAENTIDGFVGVGLDLL
jgi:hypothetical protein